MEPREEVAGPPAGFRRSPPDRVKVEVLERQGYFCAACRRPFEAGKQVNFDHRPSITSRRWNAEAMDTIPPVNDVSCIEALHPGCHKTRTRTDIKEYAKLKRIKRKRDEFDVAMLFKKPGQPRQTKASILSRKFRNRRKTP